MRKVTLTLLIVASMALGGCYESTDITLHDPGMYRGGERSFAGQAGQSGTEGQAGRAFPDGTDRSLDPGTAARAHSEDGTTTHCLAGALAE